MQQSFQIEWLEQRWLLADIRFAVIGDYGVAGGPVGDVANMIKSFNPDFITTVGDNNYDVGAASTIDPNIGRYFHEYIYNYTGTYGPGSPTRRFFPSLGNHDWGNGFPIPNGANPYLAYFDLPTSKSGGERYYNFVQGSVHFFMLDSDPNEPNGRDESSIQAQWLRSALAGSTSPHKVVMLHHAPYSSSEHGSDSVTQWPFSQWGATAVLAGHDHTYERLFAEGIPYFVNGLGGRSLYTFPTTVPQSQFKYNANYGAMIVDANEAQMTFKFYARTGALIDTSTLVLANQLPIVSVQATDANGAEAGTNAAAFTISRPGSTAAPLTVNFTLGGTAVMGVDYQTVPLSVTIPIGSSSATVQLNPINDFLAEGAESVVMTLASSASFNLGQDNASTATIADDDGTSALLFSGGSTWKYLDNGSNQGTAWRAIDFVDTSWSSGGARFGYGDPGMVTTINAGPSNNRYITHYFRTTFNIANANAIDVAQLNVLRDDGAIIYLNGSELWRTNMPAGTVTSSTLAATGVGGADETTFFTHTFDPSLLQTGTNYLAVELHQSSITTSDAVFDMYITGGVDNVTPIVANQVFDFESWHELRFTFSEKMFSLDVSDLIVTNLANPNDPLPSGAFTLTAAGEPTVASWRAKSLLPDGLYRALLPAGSTRDRAGNQLSDAVMFDFRVFRGDADGNGIIDFDDYSHIDNGFNNNRTGFSNGDFDYNGIVDFDDYSLIDQAFNMQGVVP